MDYLRDQLQRVLGAAYTIERELGGGGMSRVFLAEEVAFGRKVVVKVLPPELVERVNVERFEREIMIAANLQHPHIVPILSAGHSDDSPYYTMPFVEGASLRARLQHEGPLPIGEAVFVLRDVAKALAYAHERGVVHRDIKPDNVLLAGGSATVTDFGIAKALAASKTSYGDNTTLTQVGMSIGTPAYMAPEQAAGDPDTDHRADIYSFGCVMYELLTGRPPFAAPTPQRMYAAQMFETARPVDELRAETPAPLARLTMHCLEKDPAARPQHAVDLIRALESIGTGATARASMAATVKILGVYAAAFVVVWVFARWAMLGFGLPDWVLTGAIIVMALGFPFVLLAAVGTRMTLRRAARGGALALAAFTLIVITTAALRSAGIGPFASLLTAGTLSERDRVIVADFEAPASDSALSGVLAEAARTSLAQSSVVAVMPASAINDALRRMNRPRDTRINAALAREIAVREGVKAVLVGKVTPLSEGYVVSEALLTAATGDELAAYRETVGGQRELIESIDRLTRKVRGRIGESLRTIRAEAPLERVTTSSLEALKKYSEGLRANNFTNEYAKATALFEEAVAMDSTFGMAYRSMSQSLLNQGNRARAVEKLERAFALRERMTERERLFTDATWFGIGPHADRAKQVEAYERLIDVRPDEWGAMQNLAQIYMSRRQFTRAESLWKRAMTYRAEQFSPFNIIGMHISAGNLAAARRSFEDARERYPANPRVPSELANLLYNEGKLDSAVAVLPLDDSDHTILRVLRGQRAGAVARPSDLRPLQRQVRGSPVFDTVPLTHLLIWQDGRPADAVRMMDAALIRAPLASRPPNQRDYLGVAAVYGMAKEPDRARRLLAEYDAAVTDSARRRLNQPNRDYADGWLAIASGNPGAAVAFFRKAEMLPDGPFGSCMICADPGVGMAYDAAGKSDSAIVVYEHFVSTPVDSRWYPDAVYLPWILRRLGELYEARGDQSNAAARYSRFVELWSRSDAALQPQVAEVRRRLAKLARPR